MKEHTDDDWERKEKQLRQRSERQAVIAVQWTVKTTCERKRNELGQRHQYLIWKYNQSAQQLRSDL